METRLSCRYTPRAREALLLRALCWFFALFLLVSVLYPLKAHAEITANVLRFHVVANSDSEEDQRIKLLVRDRLLEWTGEGLAICEDRAEAEAYLVCAKDGIVSRVRLFLQSLGVSYSATASVQTEQHAARTYGDVTLPQGTYLTFRVVLGEGDGENFFCVLFPPLCKNTAKLSQSEILSEYKIGGAARRFVTRDGTEIRFGLWEKVKALFDL